MTTWQVLLVILLWLLVNAFFPLFLNSVERQYQQQIDRLVVRSISIVVAILLRAFQILSIMIMLPTVVLVTVTEQMVGARGIEMLCKRSWLLADIVTGVKFVLRRDFPDVFRAVLSQSPKPD